MQIRSSSSFIHQCAHFLLPCWASLLVLTSLLLDSSCAYTTMVSNSTSSPAASLFGSDPWNVDCGSDRLCDTDNPICCVTDQMKPFCIPGGQSCCTNRAGFQGGCVDGETCCPGGTASDPCCPVGTSCGEDGQCFPDTCAAHTSDGTCTNDSKCGWCCSTHRCVAQNTAVCPEGVKTLPQQCSSNCSYQGTCESCDAMSGCGWCCETQTCMAAVTAKCSHYEWVSPGLSCAACETGGGGLYHISNTSYTTMVFTTILPIICGCFLLTVCCQKIAQTRRDRRRAQFMALLTDDDTERPTPNHATGATPGLRKYGFGATTAAGAEDEDDEDTGAAGGQHAQDEAGPTGVAGVGQSSCSICMERPAEIVFLPCYHAYCCAQCSTRLEGRGTSPVQCPFCRTRVETMVNLNRIFFAPPEGPVAATTSPPPQQGEDVKVEEKS